MLLVRIQEAEEIIALPLSQEGNNVTGLRVDPTTYRSRVAIKTALRTTRSRCRLQTTTSVMLVLHKITSHQCWVDDFYIIRMQGNRCYWTLHQICGNVVKQALVEIVKPKIKEVTWAGEWINQSTLMLFMQLLAYSECKNFPFPGSVTAVLRKFFLKS